MTPLDIPKIETERLRLRAHRADDFDAYVTLWADPAVNRYLGNVPLSREACWAKMLSRLGVWHFMGFGFFAVEEKASGAFVGEVGFHDLRRDIMPSLAGTMEAGWALLPRVQGRGFASEAMREAMRWARADFPGMPMSCIIDSANADSIRVAERLGFAHKTDTVYHGQKMLVFELPT